MTSHMHNMARALPEPTISRSNKLAGKSDPNCRSYGWIIDWYRSEDPVGFLDETFPVCGVRGRRKMQGNVSKGRAA